MESKIFERLCGEGLFIFLAILFSFFISRTNNYKKIKRYMFFYVIILSILSYSFKPFCEIDLTNQQSHVLNYYNYTWNEMFELLFQSTDYTRFFYFYIINRLGDVNLLQTFVTTIVYSIIFYTIIDYGKLKKYNGLTIARTMFLFMMLGQYIDLISGIRSTTAYTLIYLCFYREFVKKKSIFSNLFIYFLAIGFHISVVPLILVRVIFLILKKEKNGYKRLFNITIFLSVVFITLRYGNVIINAVSEKANTYLSKSVYSTFNGYLISIFNLFVLLYLINIYKKKNKNNGDENNLEDKNYIRFIMIYVLIILLFSFEYSIFHRYIIFLSMITLPIVMTAFNYLNIENDGNREFVISKNNAIYAILLLLMSIFSFSMGDIKLLQFWK